MNLFVVTALYQFVELADLVALRMRLLEICQKQNVKGSLLLATEGINGTIAGSRSAIDKVLDAIKADTRFHNLEHKESYCVKIPFRKLKVRLKKEIVTFGVTQVDPTQKVGEYLDPTQWNELLKDPKVLLVDTRNDYEVKLGYFKNAKNPQTSSFREFPNYVAEKLIPYKHQKIALYCTGGIRCEKATSYLLDQGFDKIYHLKGGILNYLEKTPKEQSLWQGECFVFDDRVSVDSKLEPGSYTTCHGCSMPVSETDRKSKRYQAGICCPNCHDKLSAAKRQRLQQRLLQKNLTKLRHKLHSSN